MVTCPGLGGQEGVRRDRATIPERKEAKKSSQAQEDIWKANDNRGHKKALGLRRD